MILNIDISKNIQIPTLSIKQTTTVSNIEYDKINSQLTIPIKEYSNKFLRQAAQNEKNIWAKNRKQQQNLHNKSIIKSNYRKCKFKHPSKQNKMYYKKIKGSINPNNKVKLQLKIDQNQIESKNSNNNHNSSINDTDRVKKSILYQKKLRNQINAYNSFTRVRTEGIVSDINQLYKDKRNICLSTKTCFDEIAGQDTYILTPNFSNCQKFQMKGQKISASRALQVFSKVFKNQEGGFKQRREQSLHNYKDIENQNKTANSIDTKKVILIPKRFSNKKKINTNSNDLNGKNKGIEITHSKKKSTFHNAKAVVCKQNKNNDSNNFELNGWQVNI